MTTDSAPRTLPPARNRYGAPASLKAGFQRFVTARARGHLLVAHALTGQSNNRPPKD